MSQPVLTPQQNIPPLDDNGLVVNAWFLYFVAISQAIGQEVFGGPNLTHVGRITKVSAAGTIAEAWFSESQIVAMVASTQAKLTALAATLGQAQIGLLVNVTDYGHVLQWTGSGWVWGPGEPGSGALVSFAIAPTGTGWHACDGSIVSYLKADGTLGSVLLPNTVATAAYVKQGSSYASAITAAATPTSSTPTFTGGSDTTSIPSSTVAVSTTTTTLAVGSATHTHTVTPTGTVSTPTISLPGDPVANLEALLWFRQ